MISLTQFCHLWPFAYTHGWRLKSIDVADHYDGPPKFIVVPPKESEQTSWAATWETLDFGDLHIVVPNWFERVINEDIKV